MIRNEHADPKQREASIHRRANEPVRAPNPARPWGRCPLWSPPDVSLRAGRWIPGTERSGTWLDAFVAKGDYLFRFR